MTKVQNPMGLKLITVFTFLMMITVNALANILPIAGVGTGEVSDYYSNLFAPSAITFAIWGVIYLLLALFTLYQLGLFNKNEDAQKGAMIIKICKLFSISSVVNTVWIFTWHYKIIWLSLILMAAILILLILIATEIKKNDLSSREKFMVRLPFSIYFGWITVATIANVTTFLVSINWGGFGISQELWTVLVLVVGAAIGIATIVCFKDFFYGLVLIWAYVGILIKHLSSYGYFGEYTAVIITVSVCLALFAATDIAILLRKKKTI